MSGFSSWLQRSHGRMTRRGLFQSGGLAALLVTALLMSAPTLAQNDALTISA